MNRKKIENQREKERERQHWYSSVYVTRLFCLVRFFSLLFPSVGPFALLPPWSIVSVCILLFFFFLSCAFMYRFLWWRRRWWWWWWWWRRPCTYTVTFLWLLFVFIITARTTKRRRWNYFEHDNRIHCLVENEFVLNGSTLPFQSKLIESVDESI